MRLSLIIISIIIGLQSTTLLFNSTQRYIFHNSLHQYSEFVSSYFNKDNQIPCDNCFNCDEEFRIGLVAFMYASALLLISGEAVWPAFISQLFWIGLQSYLCTDRGVANIRNFAVQLLILFVLASNIKCCGCNSPAQPTKAVSPVSKAPETKPSLITQRTESLSRTDSAASKTNTEKSENKKEQKHSKQGKKHK